MPKVNLARDPRAERAASMRRTINAKRGMRDIASQTELARRIGMRAGTLSAKMHSGAWTAEDLAALDKVLRFSAEELAALCRQAVKIEPYKEEFYEHLMGALIENGDNREAMAVYDDMSEMLFSDFGVMPGETLRELYRQASRTVNDHTLSMDELRMQLQEENSAGGAMLCEYDFFKILYRMQARAVARMGIAVHICLLSVTAKDGSALARRSLDGVMEKLPPLLRGNLRRGDVISRCSVSQFVIMLPQANYENSCMVAERLTGAFYRRYPHSSARLRCMVQPLIPNE